MEKTKKISTFFILAIASGIILPTGLIADELFLVKECKEDQSALRLSCDVRFSGNVYSSEVMQITSVKAEISQETTIRSVYTEYSQSTRRKTLVYILMDTSDPRRRPIVEKKILSAKNILKSMNMNTQIGVAVFDAGLREIQAPTTNEALINQALQSIQVSGQITELYRSILDGLIRVKEIPSDRQFLVLFSDGKAEDTVYSADDVLEMKGSIGIVSLGYPGSQTDRIHLQALRKLSENTNGIYIEALPGATISTPALIKMIPTLESGGMIDVDLTSNYSPGDVVTITLNMVQGQPIRFQVTPEFSTFSYWYLRGLSQWKLLSGLGIGLLLIFLLLRLMRKRKSAKLASAQSEQEVLAQLELLDSNQNWYEIKRRKISIGRGAENDLVLTNDTVSEQHAVVQLNREGKWVIIDTNSTNGVIVDNELKTSAVLDDESIIELGDVRLRFHYQ